MILFLGQLILFRLENFFGYKCLLGCTKFFVLWLQRCIIFWDSSRTKFFFPTTLLFQNFEPLSLGALSNGLISLMEGQAHWHHWHMYNDERTLNYILFFLKRPLTIFNHDFKLADWFCILEHNVFLEKCIPFPSGGAK